ncbi:MAG: DUF1841 family protein [Proteobacteria bacterium]|nr:DUF1841 family protein [Pseudomonadota bacterium]
MFGSDRDELRQMYIDAWRKSCAGELMSPLESQIAQVIQEHPEYQSAMTADTLEESYAPEGGKTNPFLHMGLHLAVREQVATNRPQGIAEVFEQLLTKAGDRLAAEHQVLDCLAEALWTAQNNNAAPDEQAYLESLRRLI